MPQSITIGNLTQSQDALTTLANAAREKPGTPSEQSFELTLSLPLTLTATHTPAKPLPKGVVVCGGKRGQDTAHISLDLVEAIEKLTQWLATAKTAGFFGAPPLPTFDTVTLQVITDRSEQHPSSGHKGQALFFPVAEDPPILRYVDFERDGLILE